MGVGSQRITGTDWKKVLANRWNRMKITKKAHAGRGQETIWEIPDELRMKINKCIFSGLTFWSIPLFSAITYSLHATTFTVTTTNISGPGSLPVAIAQANATPGDNQIQFSVTNAITLGLPLPTITNSLAITGSATVPTVISGGGILPLGKHRWIC
jgi:hypothetical protein